ncbi:MAG TPA: sigma-54 dependent transcriptional regulator [Methylomirabilota bacterium]|jgi:DNA-binding NtrC family response regulator|nr:sigma-54 dependent transcriptional regulator [Methylomirabilota bacterium]
MEPNPPDIAQKIRPTILVVDDDPGLRDSFRVILEDDYEVLDVPDGLEALEIVRSCQVDLVLLDIRLPGMDGIEVLERIKTLDEQVEVILVTAVKTLRTAVSAMKLGAFDYLTKPFDEEEVSGLIRRALDKRALEREVVFLRSELERARDFDQLVGQQPEMQRLYQLIAHVARTTSTVLITGESGTGKELVAQAIHRQGPRRDKPFVPVNLPALSETLMESEIFGHERGAFTGAYQRKLGKFELANGGTLFLDEIGALKLELQAKLLRVLQEREIERVGGSRSIKVDVRVIAATNVDLKKAVSNQTFREDLYYRLNVVPVHVPALRDRRDDIPLLADHFIRKYDREFKKHIEGVSPDALDALRDYPWPGNVREFQNVIERLVTLVDGPLIELKDLPLELTLADNRARARGVDGLPLKKACEEFERQMVLRVLERARWNQSEAARVLGLHRNTLKVKLAKWKRRSAPGGR